MSRRHRSDGGALRRPSAIVAPWSASFVIRCRSTVRRRCSSGQGITLDRSTLSSWVGRACRWLKPIYELVLGTVLSSDKVFADETTLPVLEPGRGKTRTGRLWTSYCLSTGFI